MEGNTKWKPNEQGGDSLNANDWRSQLELDIRRKVIFAIVEKLKICFPTKSETDIRSVALTFEGKIHGMATNKEDYLRKIREKIMTFDRKFRSGQSNNVQSGSSANGTNNTPDSVAQAPNQGQPLPTSMPYAQTLTSQQWLPQNNIQNNLNIPESSGLPTQVSITVSAAQNLNIQTGEGGHLNLLPGSQRHTQGREQFLPQQQQPQQPQQQPQSSNYFQSQIDQQLLKGNIRHGNLRPPYKQQQAQQPQQQQHQPSLLKQPIQQQLSHQTSLSNIQQSFPQSSALSSLPSSSQQNSQFLPIHQQKFHSSHHQPMAVPSQEQKRQEGEQVISQLTNGQDTLQNHLTSRQSNGEQQGSYRVSSSQQNNMASFQERPQQTNNIQNMHQQQRIYSHSNNASALPSQQQQYMHGGQFGNYNVLGSSLLATQGHEVGQFQPMVRQQYQLQHSVQQQPQNRMLQQPLDNTQRSQAAGSLRQTRTLADQQNQPYQLQRTPPANPSTSQDSTGKTVNASGDDWQEETYQKIKALKHKYLPVLITLFQKISDKLREVDSVPQHNMQHGPIEKLRTGKSMLEKVLAFLNVCRSSISEKHRDKFSLYEEQVLRFTKPHQTATQRPMQQQQQVHLPPSQIHQTALQSQSGHQVHVSQSLNNDQMNSRLMPSHQNKASSSVSGVTTSNTEMPHSLQTRPNMEPKDENNVMFSSGNVVLPSRKQSPASNPQVLHSNISPAQFSMFHHLPMQQQVQRQQQQPQTNQHPLQIPKSEMNDMRISQGVNIKAGLLQQHLSSSQRQLAKPLASPARMSNVSPSTSSPQIQNYSSPLLVEQQILPTTFNKTGTSSQSGGSPFVAPSPVTSFAPSSNPGDPEMAISLESPVWHAQEHPPFTLPPEQNAERPIERLIKAFQSSSPESLAQSVSEMSSVISLTDRLAGSIHSIGGSRAGLAEDLSATTRFRLEQGETNPTKRFKRSFSTMPVDIASETDSYKQFSSLESEVDSTASSGSKVNKIEPGCALLQEIREINGRLIETVVSICNEDVCPIEVTSGTIVTCSYAPVALSATFEALYKSGHISQIQPLRLLVPTNYPHSPILVEKILFDTSVHEYEDLSARTRSRFSLSMKEFSEPMSLTEIAQAWDDCARATMAEYAERHGGGTFSSKYGHWESVLRAS